MPKLTGEALTGAMGTFSRYGGQTLSPAADGGMLRMVGAQNILGQDMGAPKPELGLNTPAPM